MKQIMENMLLLQKFQLEIEPLTLSQESEIFKLRATVPKHLLERFDRMIVRGKKAVALVRNGVCGECHLRLASGALASLARMTEVHRCDNCGRYLFVQQEPIAPTGETPCKTSATDQNKKKIVSARSAVLCRTRRAPNKQAVSHGKRGRVAVPVEGLAPRFKIE